MKGGFAKMRRAEEFDALVEGRLTPIPGSSYDDLLEVVGSLRTVPEVSARPEFVADLRTQLVAAAERRSVRVVDEATALRLTPAQSRGSRERRVAAAIGGFAVVAASGSMAMASQGSLPGDVLYPVKRAIENARTNLQGDESDRSGLLLAQARNRLAEVERLSARDGADSDDIAATLEDFTSQTNQAAGLALDSFEKDGDETPLNELRAFSGDSMQRLTDLGSAVPDDARPSLVSAAQVLQAIDQAAEEACPTCVLGTIGQLPDFAALSRALEGNPVVADAPEASAAPKKKSTPEKKAEKVSTPDTSDDTTPTDPSTDSGSDSSPSKDDTSDDDGPISKTVKDITKGLGLTKDDSSDSSDDSGGLVGGVVDLLNGVLGN